MSKSSDTDCILFTRYRLEPRGVKMDDCILVHGLLVLPYCSSSVSLYWLHCVVNNKDTVMATLAWIVGFAVFLYAVDRFAKNRYGR